MTDDYCMCMTEDPGDGWGERVASTCPEYLDGEETTMTDTRTAELTEAYHVIYDIKDAALDTDIDGVRYKAYEALGALSRLMFALGIDTPTRYDGEGRKDGS